MGTCESLFNSEKEKARPVVKKEKNNNVGANLFCAPVNSSANNDNIYVDASMSQMTMTMDNSHYHEPQKPQVYQYINKYKTNGLQKSVAKASLVELGNQGNSLMYSNIKNNSRANQTSMFTSSRIDDTGYESSYDGVEMIIDGKMDEELVKKSSDKNTINNYNEFIKKKEDDNNNNTNNKKVMDYYTKNYNNKNLEKNVDKIVDNGDELSGIPSMNANQVKKKVKSNNNTNSNIQKYIQLMGKY